MGPSSEDDGKLTPCWAPWRVAVLASMGPSSEDDGKVDADINGAGGEVASMGPSSEDDGKRGGAAEVHKRSWLQWGRRPKTTERDRGLAIGQASKRLQWGRRPKTTERKTASSPDVRRCGGFNGAVVRRRRKSPLADQLIGYQNASMGPSSEDDGKCWARQYSRKANVLSFNGAVVRRRRKVYLSRMS